MVTLAGLEAQRAACRRKCHPLMLEPRPRQVSSAVPSRSSKAAFQY